MLTDLWFTNYRKHKKLHIKLKNGITGIVGDNGTGKSTVVEGIQFLFTGELFHGTKEEAVNLDTASGYVAGAFVLNEKVARIERHLDSSKVILTYDGVTYKKASEVKELWDSLLQLNSEIIKRVIIARQGHIPQLFSGDPSIREKVFQRIFLVPPTEKVRAMIWKDYLKQAPPVIPEEDVLQLRERCEQLQTQEKAIAFSLDICEILAENEQDALRNRITFIRKCIDDEAKREQLQSIAKTAAQELNVVSTQLEMLATKLTIDIVKYQKTNAMLLQQKGLYIQKLELEKELNELVCPISELEYLSCCVQITKCQQQLTDANNEIVVREHSIKWLDTERKTLRSLRVGDKCPTCSQLVDDTHLTQRQNEIASKIETASRQSLELVRVCDQLKKQIAQSEETRDNYQDYLHRHQTLAQQIARFKPFTFDDELLKSTTAVIERYAELTNERAAVLLKHEKLNNRHASVERELLALSVYDKRGDAKAEIEDITHTLSTNVENVRIRQRLLVDIQVTQAEIKSVKERIKHSEDNHKKNEKRNKYVATLNKAYDTLHSSQFPRKLIMSYADVVTEYLQENLEMFDIPYTARVAENFKIEMMDEQGRVLPNVSGGQEIVVGLSLHMALHDLFGQSFPLMIIDEGTTHLDGTNRKAYFEMIKALKAKSKLKQILIIDHDPQLSDVVDQVITLKK